MVVRYVMIIPQKKVILVHILEKERLQQEQERAEIYNKFIRIIIHYNKFIRIH